MFGFNFINRQLKILIFPGFLGYKALTFCPNYAKEIASLISSQKWLFHNFNLEDESDLYDISNYLLAKKIYNRKYTIVLDTNIYDFLLKIIRNPDKEKHRGAAALLAFCQLSEIEINPFFAVHEKLESDSIDNILDDLTLFNKINNSETTALANYALSKSNHINLNHNMDLARNSIKQEILSYQKPDEWKSLYLMTLKIVAIKYDESVPDRKKLSTYLKWLVEDFRMGVPSLVYALVIFGCKPIKRMMKYNPSDATCDKSKNIRNMTWDLFIIRHFFKKWETKKEDEEFLFASDDNAFGKILLIAIHVYKESSFDSCKNHGYINSSDLTKLNALFKQAKNIENRVYQTPNFTCEDRINHRDSLISQLEIELGIFFSHSHAPHGNAAG